MVRNPVISWKMSTLVNVMHESTSLKTCGLGLGPKSWSRGLRRKFGVSTSCLTVIQRINSSSSAIVMPPSQSERVASDPLFEFVPMRCQSFHLRQSFSPFDCHLHYTASSVVVLDLPMGRLPCGLASAYILASVYFPVQFPTPWLPHNSMPAPHMMI